MMRNARTSPSVLLVFSWNDIDIIKKLHLCPFGWHRCNFLIKKITSMPFQKNTKRTQEDALSFLINDTSSLSLSINDISMTLWYFYIFGWNLNMFSFCLWNLWLNNSSFECLWKFFLFICFFECSELYRIGI
jgi:Na+/pantothenate symporter